jgi:TRAP-type C4-dicarboxylate transport system permease small subunit
LVNSLRRLAAAIDRLNVFGAWVAAGCCAVLAAMLLIESISTAAFSWSQPWSVEYASYFTAITLFGGAGYALRHSSHIRVAVLQHYLPPRFNRIVEALCTAVALVVTSLLAFGLIELAIRSAERNSRSYFVMQTPLAWPQGVLAASVVLLALALVARLIRLALGDAPDIAEERDAGLGAVE